MHALLFRKSHRDSSIRSRKQARTVERLDSLRSALNQARIVPGTGLVSRTTPSDTARSVERSAITQIDPATARSVERLPRVKEVFRRFFRTLQPKIHVIKKQNTYDFESKHLEKNKTTGTYLPNRGSIVSIYLDQNTNITSLIL